MKSQKSTGSKPLSLPPTISIFIQGPGKLPYMRMFMDYERYVPVDTIEKADIVLFTGGEDVDPELYGEEPNPEANVYFDTRRDELDIEAFSIACGSAKMLIGICRGAQFLHVMNGGKLWQHVDNHTRSHMVYDVETGQRFFCSSTHHQQMLWTDDLSSEGAELVGRADPVLSLRKFGEKSKTLFAYNAPDVDTEVVFWGGAMPTLCFQPHPEHYYPDECRKYFFQLLERYYPKTGFGEGQTPAFLEKAD